MDQTILERIANLKAKIPENGATEEEAIAALNIAEKLMEKHGVTEADLKNIEYQRDMSQAIFEQKQKAEHPAQKYCDTTIARYCGTKCWTGRSEFVRGKRVTKIFGLNNDVAMHEFLLGMIHDSMNRGWKEYLQTNPKSGKSRHTEYWSFMIGFSERINEKLTELIEQRRVVYDTDGNDLVVVKDALIEDGRSAMLPELRLKQRRSGSVRADFGAYFKGQAAGDRVNIQRPIQAAQSGTKRLT